MMNTEDENFDSPSKSLALPYPYGKIFYVEFPSTRQKPKQLKGLEYADVQVYVNYCYFQYI